jgi:hypothetical protein
MRLSEVSNITNAQFFFPDSTTTPSQSDLQLELQVGGSADLMSDVLCFNLSRGLLVTGLINPQSVRTAEMADVAAILIVRDKIPPPETIKIAWEVGIPIFGTKMTMFEACGRLYGAGLPAADRTNGDPNPDCTAR